MAIDLGSLFATGANAYSAYQGQKRQSDKDALMEELARAQAARAEEAHKWASPEAREAEAEKDHARRIQEWIARQEWERANPAPPRAPTPPDPTLTAQRGHNLEEDHAYKAVMSVLTPQRAQQIVGLPPGMQHTAIGAIVASLRSQNPNLDETALRATITRVLSSVKTGGGGGRSPTIVSQPEWTQ